MKGNRLRIRASTAVATMVAMFMAMVVAPSAATATPAVASLATVASFSVAKAATKPTTPPDCKKVGNKLIKPDAKGPAVTRLQQCYKALGIPIGKIDGVAGYRLEHGNLTFQKWKGLDRDGVAGPETLAAVHEAVRPTKPPKGCIKGALACVDLSQQLAYLRTSSDAPVYLLDVSTGNGKDYVDNDGVKKKAVTWVGHGAICREEDEDYVSGSIENGPMPWAVFINFTNNGDGCTGWALHGSSSVPAHPASHGCVRVIRPLAKWVHDTLPIGSFVTIKK